MPDIGKHRYWSPWLDQHHIYLKPAVVCFFHFSLNLSLCKVSYVTLHSSDKIHTHPSSWQQLVGSGSAGWAHSSCGTCSGHSWDGSGDTPWCYPNKGRQLFITLKLSKCWRINLVQKMDYALLISAGSNSAFPHYRLRLLHEHGFAYFKPTYMAVDRRFFSIDF